jgi:hypothetical protein
VNAHEKDEDTFDRPRLSQQIPFEQELAQVPAGTMRRLNERFFAFTHEKDSHADRIIHAVRLAHDFLRDCHREKWRKDPEFRDVLSSSCQCRRQSLCAAIGRLETNEPVYRPGTTVFLRANPNPKPTKKGKITRPEYTIGTQEILPDGDYWFIVDDAGEKESKTGKSMIELQLLCYSDDPKKTVRVFD